MRAATSEERIAAVLVRTGRIDPTRLSRHRALVTYGIDSVLAIEIVCALEEVFGLSIPDDDIAQMRTLAETARYIDARVAETDGEASARMSTENEG